MDPAKFNDFLYWEPTLKYAPSHNATICADLGYTVFEGTETHSVPLIISITIDMYDKPDDEVAEELDE